MKVLLRDEERCLYYARQNQWVAEVKQALDFRVLTTAGRVAKKLKAEDLSVVLHYEDPRCELALNPAFCV